jgi:hypothetical protein
MYIFASVRRARTHDPAMFNPLLFKLLETVNLLLLVASAR